MRQLNVIVMVWLTCLTVGSVLGVIHQMTPFETFSILASRACSYEGMENFGLFPQHYCNYTKGSGITLPLSMIRPEYFDNVSEDNCWKVGSFLTLQAFSIKSKGYSTLDETLSILKSGKPLEIICDPAFKDYVKELFPSSIIYSSAYGATPDCFAGNMLERYDLIIVDDYSLGPQFAGLAPKVNPSNFTKSDSELYLWEEWNVFPLVDVGFLCLDKNVDVSNRKTIELIENDFKIILNSIYLEGKIFNEAILGNNTFENGRNLMCSQVSYVWHFYYHYRVNQYSGFLNGLSNDFSTFSSQYLNLNETLRISESQFKSYNRSIFDFYVAECYNCAKHKYDFYSTYTINGEGLNSCYVTPFDETFIPYLLTTILFILYIIGLLTILSKPSIRKRLISPYLAPVSILISDYIYIGFDNICSTVTLPVQFGLITAYSLSLIFVTLRVVISRYYYKIIARVRKEHVAAFRILFSKWFGNLIIIVLFIFGMAVAPSLLPIGFYYFMDDKFVLFTYYYYMAWWVIEMLTFGTLFLLDIALNYKTLRAKGLKHYLFFDDPVFIRLDIIIHLFTIFAAAPYIFESKTIFRVSRFFYFVIITLSSGGNAIIMEWFFIIRNYFKKKEEESELTLDAKIRDESYFNLIYLFSEKENNLENILCVRYLLFLEKKQEVLEKDLNYINNFFIQTYSIYELNIPNQVKFSFLLLLDKCRNGENVKFSDFDLLMSEVMKNIREIATRLETTDAYSDWKKSADELKKQVEI